MSTEKRPEVDRTRIFGEVDSSNYERERAAENSGLATGVVIGGILAFSIGLGAIVWAYANRNLSATTPSQNINPVAAPASPKPSTIPTVPSTQTTVIERTIEKPAPPAVVKVIEVPKAVSAPAMTAPAPSTSAPAASIPSVPSDRARPSSNADRTTTSEKAPATSNQAPSNQPSVESNNSQTAPSPGSEAR